MIRFSVLYPAADGATFDHDYFQNVHVPRVLEAWDLGGAVVEGRISGPYEAAVHYTFESIEALGAAVVSDAMSEIIADLGNFTSIGPVVQTSEATLVRAAERA